MKDFATSSRGDIVKQHTIKTDEMSVTLLSWGAAIYDLRLSDVDYPLTLSGETIEGYEGELLHYGTLIGPVANRIYPARVSLDGMSHELERNQDQRICLHSGAKATHRRNWQFAEATETSATLTLKLGDGECGFPGNRTISAKFEILPNATLRLKITGTTDAKTVMNFANHSYWNLDGAETYEGHQLQIDADHYLPCDDDALATGEIRAVEGGPMDFRHLRNAIPGQPAFDHNFCLSDTIRSLRPVLTLRGQSGVQMVMATNQPGLQVYDARAPHRPGKQPYEGLAFEAQGWPNAPHNPDFPSIEVTPEAPYEQVTEWRFSKPET